MIFRGLGKIKTTSDKPRKKSLVCTNEPWRALNKVNAGAADMVEKPYA